jgi:class 3 adenylate cyclase/predicted ATPase/phosphoribosyl-ATP pyrophosphohydrolase
VIILNCFNCGLKLNSDDEKECRFCGVRFSAKCPVCGALGPQSARFCLSCGSRLSKPDEHSSVKNYGTLSEGRKNVAVIFADVSGFTALSEKMDPEEVREIINGCFNYITSPVYELEGTIDKYIGDCVMILFGARYTHTDDAKRAVMCAIKMMDLVGDFSHTLSASEVTLNLSIGINYGLVVTGGVGNYFDRDYTVMGDIVNTAQRLQSSADEGMILVSDSVYMETKGSFEYSEAKKVRVKNKEDPVICYIPLRVNTEYYFENEMSFIERQKEMGLLNSLYNDTLNTGLKCVAVTGEAGMGKTRLLKEFTSKLGSDVKIVWVDCGNENRSRSYILISGILSGIMNINPQDSSNMKQHRLISFLDYIMGSYSEEEIKRNFDFLGLLMGLDRDSEFQSIFESMSYDDIGHEILKQLSLFFTNLCRKQKLVVVVDDAHLADGGSMQILNDLIPAVKEIKGVFIFLSRYELKSLLPENKPMKCEISLNPLSKAGIISLACSFLKCGKLSSRKLHETITNITKGNPLYVKELASAIKRKGIYYIRNDEAYIEESDLDLLPESMQSLIASKISALDETSLIILQAASAIGKKFPFSLLAHLLDYSVSEEEISGLPVQLNIIQLKTVHTSSGELDKIFEFTHEIEREVIYEGILNRKKKELHKKIGEYIEERYDKKIENYYELLGEHFSKAGMLKKASDYYYKTALKYKRDFSFTYSLDYFEKFLELMGNRTEKPDYRVFNSYKEIGHIHFINANYEKALEYLNKALNHAGLNDEIHSAKLLIAEVYKDQGLFDEAMTVLNEIEPKIREDNPIYGGWLQMKCNILRIQGDTAALNLARKSEKILLKVGDYRNLSETMKHAGMIYFIKGDIDNALSYIDKSYKYAEKHNLLDIMAKVSGDLGIVYHSTGMISKAMEYFNKSMDISRQLSYRKGVIAACINLGVLYMDKGLLGRACELFNESLDICREISSRLYECISLTNLGDMAYEQGDSELSNQYYEKSLGIAREINAPIEQGVNYIGLSRILIGKGYLSDAAQILEKTHRIFEESDDMVYLADYYTYKGLIEQNEGRWDSAFGCYDKAVEIAQECKNDNKWIKALCYKGNLLIREKRFEEAAEFFNEAAAASEKLESDYEAAKCWFGRYRAMKEAGIMQEALKSLKKAKTCIKSIDKCKLTCTIENE